LRIFAGGCADQSAPSHGCALRHKPKPEPKRDYRGER
jgi:hypothetical protein